MNQILQNTLAESVYQIASGVNIVALQRQMRPGSGAWEGGAWGWGVGFLWPLFWLLVLAALIGFIVYLLTRQTSSSNTDQALNVLRERYARGEIEDEEFEERASRLRNHP